MIEPENETHDHNHKPVKGSLSAEALPELQQYNANTVYHDPPLLLMLSKNHGYQCTFATF
jgi:hypothetical protein